MSVTQQFAGRSQTPSETARAKPRGRGQRILISVLAFVGVAIILFPTASDWFSAMNAEERFGSFESASDALGAEERMRILENAREYNTRLPAEALVDPYREGADAKIPEEDQADYYSQLQIGPDEPMAWIEVPKINTKLPILHGTNDETLDWNAGHLYGSSLPVGGESTHSIIVGHSGRPNARLFTDLIKLKTGDVFVTQTLGERMYYQVDNIEVVETVYFGDALKPVEGKDYVTLMTCTPTGINSHRLLIRGERIPNPEEDGSKDLATIAPGPGFPWWALAVLGAPTAAWVLLGAVDRRQIRRLLDPEPKETL